MKEIKRHIVKFIIYSFIMIAYRVKIVGKGNIPKEGAGLICPNHVHAMDSVAVITTARRPIRALAKQSLYKYWIIRFLAETFGVYPVNREAAAISAVKTTLKLLKENELVLIFPEGTRNGMAKGAKVRDGAVSIAITAGVPIIPVGVQGEFKPFRKVKINVGKPIYYDSSKINLKDKTETENLTNELMKEIVRLTKEKI